MTFSDIEAIRSIEQAEAEGTNILVKSIDSGHMVMLKDPDAVARCLRDLVHDLSA